MEWQKILVPIVSSAATGLVMWIAMGGRRALKNFGKTELEIAVDRVEEAAKEVEVAMKTPDKDDDVDAKARLQHAKTQLSRIKRLKSVLDAFGDTDGGGSE